MKDSQLQASREFIFWLFCLMVVSLSSVYVWGLELEDTGRSVGQPFIVSVHKKTPKPSYVAKAVDEKWEQTSYQYKDSTPKKISPVAKVNTSPQKKQGLDESEIDELFLATLSLIDRGEWREGEKNLLKIIEANPEHVEALRELAMLNLLDKKDSATAMVYFEKAFKVDPNDSSVMHELLQLYQEQGSLVKGLNFFKSIPEEKKQGPAVDYAIATALSTSGNMEEAINFYQKAADLNDEGDLSLKEDLADAMSQVGRNSEAIEYYTSLLSEVKDPDQLKTIKVKMIATMIDGGDVESAKELAEELKSLS